LPLLKFQPSYLRLYQSLLSDRQSFRFAAILLLQRLYAYIGHAVRQQLGNTAPKNVPHNP